MVSRVDRQGLPSCTRLIGAVLLSAVLADCALGSRDDFTMTDQVGAVVPGFDGIRIWGDAPSRDIARAVIGDHVRPTAAHDVNYLALSGGGAGGSFSAGLLAGWTRSGTRPVFDVVSGVSTGALIAPFAFLGSSEDAVVAKLYTGDGAAGIGAAQNPFKILAGDGLMDPAPLRTLVETYATADLMDRIAAEHRTGRRLLVVTTNLDAQRPVVWDMGAIAASGRPDALALFRDVLMASASVPAVFPPVMIKAQAGDHAIEEMHVDGVTTDQIFIQPDILAGSSSAVPRTLRRKIHIWAVVNNTLPPEFAMTARSTLPIAYRSIATMMKAQTSGLVTASYEAAQRLGMDFNVAYIDRAVPFQPQTPFASGYMDTVFAIGTREAQDGTVWHKTLDGLSVLAEK